MCKKCWTRRDANQERKERKERCLKQWRGQKSQLESEKGHGIVNSLQKQAPAKVLQVSRDYHAGVKSPALDETLCSCR